MWIPYLAFREGKLAAGRVLTPLKLGVGGILLLAGTALSACMNPFSETATLVLQGGQVITVEPDTPKAEAIAVRGDRILAVGSNAEIARYIGFRTKVIDLHNKTVVPGFIESHARFLSLGFSQIQLDLRSAQSWNEVVKRVAEASKRTLSGEWIYGWGWDEAKWTEVPVPNVNGSPVHYALSRAVPRHPVLLKHASGKASFVNWAALKAAQITKFRSSPKGGLYVKGLQSELTGELRGTAQARVEDAATTQTDYWIRRKADLASGLALSRGITSFQDAGASLEEIKILRELADEDQLGVRLWVTLSHEIDNKTLAEVMPNLKYKDTKHHRINISAVERVIDGSPEFYDAWLLEPYADDPEHQGPAFDSIQDLEITAKLSEQHGFQLSTQAIGDKAVRDTLDIYTKVLGEKAQLSNHRWRIEYAQHIQPQDVPRFAKLGVVAAMPATRCTSAGLWVADRLGDDRAQKTLCLWKSLLDSGAVVTSGSDAPNEEIDPIKGYYALVTRTMSHGKSFNPKQVMTRAQALKAYTLDAAYAAFEDDIKGSIKPGKLADLTILSQDITAVSEQEILNTQVEMTVVGGQVLYERKPTPN